jgi:hypothetical protein
MRVHFGVTMAEMHHEHSDTPGVLDVAFAEDASRVRSGHAAQNLAIIHRFALNLLRQETTCKRGVKTKRLRAGWAEAYLVSLLRLVSA